MPRKHARPVHELVQFLAQSVDASYSFNAHTSPHHLDPLRATQSLQLRGPITYPEKSRQSYVDLYVYADTEHLTREDARRDNKPIGSLDARSGVLSGAVSVPDTHYPSILTIALSGRLQCVSLDFEKSERRRGAWLITGVGLSTEQEM